MHIEDERSMTMNGQRLDQGVRVFPFLDETASAAEMATSGYITVRTWDIRHLDPLPTPIAIFNLHLVKMTVQQVQELRAALDKVLELMADGGEASADDPAEG